MKKNFSLTHRLNSFGYALRGLMTAFKTQHNIWIHSAAVIAAAAAGFLLKISPREWGLIVLAIGLVLVTELVNTAIEFLVDLVSPAYNHKAGKIKDIAAGAVLIAAVIAIIIGLIVFLPKIIAL